MRLRADSARVEWEAARKRWEVHIFVGAEVIKRPLPNQAIESGEDAIRRQAVAAANDEGYELDPQNVAIPQNATTRGGGS
jgi:hypothetical protein